MVKAAATLALASLLGLASAQTLLWQKPSTANPVLRYGDGTQAYIGGSTYRRPYDYRTEKYLSAGVTDISAGVGLISENGEVRLGFEEGGSQYRLYQQPRSVFIRNVPLNYYLTPLGGFVTDGKNWSSALKQGGGTAAGRLVPYTDNTGLQIYGSGQVVLTRFKDQSITTTGFNVANGTVPISGRDGLFILRNNGAYSIFRLSDGKTFSLPTVEDVPLTVFAGGKAVAITSGPDKIPAIWRLNGTVTQRKAGFEVSPDGTTLILPLSGNERTYQNFGTGEQSVTHEFNPIPLGFTNSGLPILQNWDNEGWVYNETGRRVAVKERFGAPAGTIFVRLTKDAKTLVVRKGTLYGRVDAFSGDVDEWFTRLTGRYIQYADDASWAVLAGPPNKAGGAQVREINDAGSPTDYLLPEGTSVYGGTRSLLFAVRQRTLTNGNRTAYLETYLPRTGKRQVSVSLGNTAVQRIAWSGNGKTAAVATEGGVVFVDTSNGTSRAAGSGVEFDAAGGFFSDDGALFVSGTSVYKTSDGSVVLSMGDVEPATNAIFSADLSRVLVSSDAGPRYYSLPVNP